MKKCVLLLILGVLTPALHAQDEFSTIEERMTGKEFSESGLSKLTPDELASLNRWLRAHSVATLENATEPYSDMRGMPSSNFAEMDDVIVSRIKGPFSGWVGDGTVIELENGMIWKTSERSQLYIPETEGIVATIDKGMIGGWRLKVEGYNKSVRVKRIQ